MTQAEYLASILETICNGTAGMCPAKAQGVPCPFGAEDINKCKSITKEDWICHAEKIQ